MTERERNELCPDCQNHMTELSNSRAPITEKKAHILDDIVSGWETYKGKCLATTHAEYRKWILNVLAHSERVRVIFEPRQPAQAVFNMADIKELETIFTELKGIDL